jgi:hypothetical protein
MSYATNGQPSRYLQVFMSAELRTQGLGLLDRLIAKRLAFGGPVFSGPARFLWKDEVVEHDYCFVVTYTRVDLLDELIAEAERHSVEEVCMISTNPLYGSPALIRLLDAAFEDRQTAPTPRAKAAVAALTFVPDADIPTRTKDSFGDLTEATTDDPTR